MSLHIEPGVERLGELPQQLEKQLDLLKLNGLKIWKRTFRREKSIRFIDAKCGYCNRLKTYHVDSLLRGTTKACACQRNRKYGGNPRADILGEHYDRIVRRCNRASQRQSKNQPGTGKCAFASREHFVRWAMETLPDADFRGLMFERVDNHGDYSPDNLRLATATKNQRNREDNVHLSYKGHEMHWSDWLSPYCPRTTQSYAAKGMTGEQIIGIAQKAVNEKRKRWRSIEKRLAELGYIGVQASQSSPATEGMSAEMRPEVSGRRSDSGNRRSIPAVQLSA